MLPSSMFKLLLATLLVGEYACALRETGELHDASVTDASVDDVSDVSIVDVTDAPIDTLEELLPASPADIADAGLQLWVRDFFTFDDAGDGGGVTAWLDQSDAGSAHDLTLPTTAAKPPVYEASSASYNANSVLHFDSSGFQRLQNTALVVAQPLTVFIVARATTDVSYFFDSATASRVSALTLSSTRLTLFTSGGSYAPILGNQPTNTPQIIVAIYNGAQSALFQNSNVSVTALNPGSGMLGGLTLGAYQGGSSGLAGEIAEFAIWARVLPTESVLRLNLYASQRYSIALQ